MRKGLRRVVSLGSLAYLAKHPWLWLRLPSFLGQLMRYKRMEKAAQKLVPLRLYPCLEDAVTCQQTNGYYFYQDCWAARQVFREKPEYVVDVGSTVLLVGIISQFVPCVSVDIRPIQSKLEGLRTVAGSVTELPFEANEVPCLTTMCVLEHIGLGRYGDPLSATGTDDAVKEIARVIKPGGIVVFSVPVAEQSLLEFNANRRFTSREVDNFFPGWEVVDSCVLVPHAVAHTPDIIRQSPDPILCRCVRKPLI